MIPGGTPPVTGRFSDQVVPTRTAIVRFDKKVAMSFRICVEAPFLANASKQRWKDNLLKALA